MVKPNTKNLASVFVLALLSVSLGSVFVAAQLVYTTEKTISFTIPSNGVFSTTVASTGVSLEITGTAGATGTLTIDAYNGNPYPTATIPSGISLNDFIAITFNMNAQDFTQAIVTITYTDAQVQGLKQPYALYKYSPSSNSYNPLPSTVNTAAKTITATLTSISDPLLAIGGKSTSLVTSSGTPAWVWAAVFAVIIVIIIAAVLMLSRPEKETLPKIIS
jgi:hypothetical protein